ncbi:MAG: hypothetical protein BGO55_00945 [Sphingobacteriales bacterium 50-39]|nr:MAG: hypothetical protein BGO55_00945 [Sphingobacteriales bacterium 50-39]
MQLTLPYTETMSLTTPVIRRGQYRYFLLVACLYFFFNSFLLPDGLLYTILLSPVFLYWLMSKKVHVMRNIILFFLCWLPFLVIHYSYGISLHEYLKSSALYLTVFVFSMTVYYYFKHYSFTYEPLMETVLKINFLFVLVCVFLLVANQRDIVWSVTDISEGVSDFPRLRMLTYEPSYYSLLLIPSFLFYFQYIFYRNMTTRKWVLLATVLISLGLSLSYGAIFISILTLGLFVSYNLFSNVRRRHNKRFVFFLSAALVLGIVLIFTLFAESGFVLRILNIVSGTDSSINNRSSQAYFLALSIADLKSTVFGVGPGQLKLLGENLISLVYAFSDQPDSGQMARIPSSMAETLATFGWVGFSGKLLVELILFRKTKVKTSSFRLCLFIFMFIYQFVGSFSTNIVEIFFWTLAFSRVFPDQYFKAESPSLNKS